MATTYPDRRVWRRDETVEADEELVVILPSVSHGRTSVSVRPGAGGTANLQTTMDTAEAIALDTAVWTDWPGGAVAVATDDVLISPVTAVKLLAIDDDADFILVQ